MNASDGLMLSLYNRMDKEKYFRNIANYIKRILKTVLRSDTFLFAAYHLSAHIHRNSLALGEIYL